MQTRNRQRGRPSCAALSAGHATYHAGSPVLQHSEKGSRRSSCCGRYEIRGRQLKHLSPPRGFGAARSEPDRESSALAVTVARFSPSLSEWRPLHRSGPCTEGTIRDRPTQPRPDTGPAARARIVSDRTCYTHRAQLRPPSGRGGRARWTAPGWQLGDGAAIRPAGIGGVGGPIFSGRPDRLAAVEKTCR